MNKKILAIISIALVSLLTGCGGGGGGTVASLTASDYETTEYNNQYGLGKIKASSIYADGYSGSSVTVAVIDTGVDLDHPDLVDNIASGGYDYVDGDSDANPNGQGTYMSHGTHVAGIIAGMKNSTGMHGVAYNAKILPLRAGISSGSLDYVAIENSIDRAISQGAKIINASYGASNMLVRTANKYLSAHNNDIITVAAAGNDGNNNPDYPALLPSATDYTALQDTLIAVVATDSNNTIASFSNKCGTAKNWCMAAPGVDIYSTVDTTDNTDTNSDGYDTYDGTSMAAPHVAGAAAVLRSKWPSKSNSQIVDILFDTATDLGTSGVDTTYGHGLLNLQNAMSAQGVLSLMSESGTSYSLEDSRMSFSEITGDVKTKGLITAVYDKFDRDFYTGISSLTKTNTISHLDKELNFKPISLELNELGISYGVKNNSKYINTSIGDYQYQYSNGNQVSNSLMQTDNLSDEFTQKHLSNTNTFLNQVNDAHTFSVSSDMGDIKSKFGIASGKTNAENDIVAVNLSMLSKPLKGISLETQFTNIFEEDSFLSNSFTGAYNIDSSTTRAVNLNTNWQLDDNLVISSQFAKGKTYVSANKNSVISDVSNINTGGYSIGLRKNSFLTQNDSLYFQYKKSVGIDSGEIKLTSASGLNSDDSVKYSSQSISLESQNKETLSSVGYERNLLNDAKFIGLVNYINNPNHNSEKTDEKQILLKWSKNF